MHINFKNQKGFAHLILILIIAAIVAGGGYYLYTKQKGSVVVSPSPSVSVSETPDAMADWKTYTNVQLGYSFRYPKDWIAENVNMDQYQDSAYPQGKKPSSPDIIQYFELRLERESMEDIRQVLNSNIGGSNVTESAIVFGGENAYAYLEKLPMLNLNGELVGQSYEVLVQHQGKVFMIWTQIYSLNEVKNIFASFKFTK